MAAETATVALVDEVEQNAISRPRRHHHETFDAADAPDPERVYVN